MNDRKDIIDFIVRQTYDAMILAKLNAAEVKLTLVALNCSCIRVAAKNGTQSETELFTILVEQMAQTLNSPEILEEFNRRCAEMN